LKNIIVKDAYKNGFCFTYNPIITPNIKKYMEFRFQGRITFFMNVTTADDRENIVADPSTA
jgi:hypothetical protein